MRKSILRHMVLLATFALCACGDDDSSSIASNPGESGELSIRDSLLDSIQNNYRLDSCLDVQFDTLTLVDKRSSYFLCNANKKNIVTPVETSSSEKPESSSSVSSSSNSSSSVSSSSVSSSSSNTSSSSISLTLEYDCSEYNCFYTGYLNSKMLGSGMYGQYLDTRDGQVYRTVKIGSQTWMAQNLNYATPKSTCFKDDLGYCLIYGRLYYQEEALKACPEGWHLPSSDEWDELEEFAAADVGSENVGNSLKAVETWTREIGWDQFGFSGLASRYFGNVHICGGEHGVYWTSEQYEYRCLLNDRSDLYSYWEAYSVDWGMSVRCIQDAEDAGEESGS